MVFCWTGISGGRNNFSKLISNLKLLKEMKAARGIRYPEVTFLFTVSRVNCDDLPRIVDIAEAFGVGCIIVQLQVFYDRERFKRESLFFARDAYDKNIAAALHRASTSDVSLLHPASFDGRSFVLPEIIPNLWLGRDSEGKIQCHAKDSTCYVRYNGVIEACCAPDRNIMGSLDFDSFEDIWNGPQYRAPSESRQGHMA